MAQTKQEFYIGEKVHVREDVDDMPYGYMTDMKKLRGTNVTIAAAYHHKDTGEWSYRIKEDLGYSWHAMCFCKIESDLPEFEGGTVSDLLSMFE